MKSNLHTAITQTCGIFLVLLSWMLLSGKPAHALTAANTQIKSTGQITYTDTNSNSYSGESLEVIVTVETVTGVTATCADAQSTPSNKPVGYLCTVKNEGNNSNTFTLAASSTPAWVTKIYVDTNEDNTWQDTETTETATSGALAAGASYKFFVTVKPDLDTPNAATSAFTLTVTDGGTPAASATVSKTTTAQAPKLTVVKKVRNFSTSPAGAFAAAGVTAKPGEILEYQLQVTNSGQFKASNVVLTDPLDSHLTHVANGNYIGPDASGPSGAVGANGKGGTGNFQAQDLNSDDTWACTGDVCGVAYYDTSATPKNVIFKLGTGATEPAVNGGTLDIGSSVYVYHRATVD